jgi:hypothetical protein
METTAPPITTVKENVWFWLILGFAFLLRLAVSFNTAIINPDGAIYIDQARMIYYGLLELQSSHESRLLTPYPFLIAGLFSIAKNWIAAAVGVSVICGTALLYPVYLIARRFLAEGISLLVLLVFAVIPTLVFNSVDIIRDPLCWLFTAWGLHLFLGSSRGGYSRLPAAGFLYLLAVLTRLDAIIFPLISCLWLLFRGERRFARTALFLAPWLILGALAVIAAAFFGQMNMLMDRTGLIMVKFTHAFQRYGELRFYLRGLMDHPPAGFTTTFFDNIRSTLWLLPLGILFQNGIEAFHYPFFLFFITGLVMAGSRLRKNPDLRFLTLLLTGNFALLYLFILSNWEMEHRWIVFAILTAAVYIGLGLDRFLTLLRNRAGMSSSRAIALTVFLILAFSLPKDLKPREQDKAVFKQIGQTIARLESGRGEIEVLTLGTSGRLVSFYANLRVKGAPYPDKQIMYGDLTGPDYEGFLRNLRERRIRYLVWEERHWPRKDYDLLQHLDGRDFAVLGEWKHRDTGRLILLRVLTSAPATAPGGSRSSPSAITVGPPSS